MKIDSKLIELLNQALRVEYRIIVHFPIIAKKIKDEYARNLFISLGEASIHHADVVSGAIRSLGGDPDFTFELLPEQMGIMEILETQLELENQALALHTESSKLTSDGLLKAKLVALASDEESHIKSVNEIMSILSSK